MTTPVKPTETALTKERAVHIDCFKKIKENYEDFLAASFENGDESVYDRLVRLGVNTLYIHEKWNDLQNSPILTRKTANRLNTIISECHERGIKVIPYFGYEISSLAPYYREMLPRVCVVNNAMSRWYRVPPQRDSKACQNSEWQDFHRNGVVKLMDNYGFDGIYLDGTAYLWACKNEAHGCGFRTKDGEIHESYPVFAVRENMKKLYYDVVEKRDGIINCHAGSAFNMPALSFATSLWDGEVFQSGFIKGIISKLPDGYFKCLYTGRNLGLKIYMLCYLNPPEWSFDMALAVSLPFGILPKVNDVGEPLEKISKIWKIYENFGVDSAEFIPFYSDEDTGVTVSDERIKTSVYKKDGRKLIILAVTDKDISSSFTVECEKNRIKDAVTGELLSEKGRAELELSGFDFRLLEAF